MVDRIQPLSRDAVIESSKIPVYERNQYVKTAQETKQNLEAAKTAITMSLTTLLVALSDYYAKTCESLHRIRTNEEDFMKRQTHDQGKTTAYNHLREKYWKLGELIGSMITSSALQINIQDPTARSSWIKLSKKAFEVAQPCHEATKAEGMNLLQEMALKLILTLKNFGKESFSVFVFQILMTI